MRERESYYHSWIELVHIWKIILAQIILSLCRIVHKTLFKKKSSVFYHHFVTIGLLLTTVVVGVIKIPNFAFKFFLTYRYFKTLPFTHKLQVQIQLLS